MNKKKTGVVRLTTEHYEIVREKAYTEKRFQSDIVKEALDLYLNGSTFCSEESKNKEIVLMPKELTEELKEILGEKFHEEIEEECLDCYGVGCDECDNYGYEIRKISIGMDTITAIYNAIVSFSRNKS